MGGFAAEAGSEDLIQIDRERFLNERRRLRKFEEVGGLLWQWVRHWPLCGADSQAVFAVVELGGLLGEKVQDGNLAQAATAGVEEGLKAAAEWAENDGWLAGQVGPRRAGEIGQRIRAIGMGSE